MTTIESRVQAGKLAREIAESFGSELPDDESRLAFIERLQAIWFPQQPSEQAESLPPIARLGAEELVFGVHSGKSFDDAPLDYLDWLCGAQEESVKKLRAYLKHPQLESRRRGIER